MVHKLFDDVLGGEIHALSIRAKAPEEVEAAT
jgi:stress-induced morphogen